MELNIVFVHGWSVTNLDTYGELPLRLRAEATQLGINIQVKEIFLGSYISFHDEVRMNDISRAFRNAVSNELSEITAAGSRFICITHSTGGPVIRDWWKRYYKDSTEICPMSHLVMLAPANFGSALAQLGKSRLSRLKSWWNGVEPGVGVLNWLALGSSEAWDLNRDWIYSSRNVIGENGIFPFVITGQDIDRKFYDHLNPYTGENGSDGVVRVAGANLQGRYVKLTQPAPVQTADGNWVTGDFQLGEIQVAPRTPLRVLLNKSHSGDLMGIMKSVKNSPDNSSETIKAILDCINVKNNVQYDALCDQFDAETKQVQDREVLEIQSAGLFSASRYFIHDHFSMVIFRVTDSEGYPVTDYDLILTAGINNSPDHLPEGFCADRQRNLLSPETITYYFDYEIMNGSPEIKNGKGETVRPAINGTDMLGFEIQPRPADGFVRYIPCRIKASTDMLDKVLIPNSTTLIDICLQRVVDKQVFRAEKLIGNTMPSKDDGEFSDLEPGNEIVQ